MSDLDAFRRSVWDYFEVDSPDVPTTVLAEESVPGARVNCARQLLRHADALRAAGHPAMVFQNERLAQPTTLSWPELRRQSLALAQYMR